MKNIALLIVILLSASCKKEENQDFNVYTRVQIVVLDIDGNDLLDKNNTGSISLDDITLSVSGDNDKNNGNPPYYPYYTLKDYLSPQYKYIQWSEELNKNYLSIVMDHTRSNTSTIIDWGNGFAPDTIRAEIIFDKKRMEVKYSNLYLNEDLVRTENSKGERIVKIQK